MSSEHKLFVINPDEWSAETSDDHPYASTVEASSYHYSYDIVQSIASQAPVALNPSDGLEVTPILRSQSSPIPFPDSPVMTYPAGMSAIAAQGMVMSDGKQESYACAVLQQWREVQDETGIVERIYNRIAQASPLEDNAHLQDNVEATIATLRDACVFCIKGRCRIRRGSLEDMAEHQRMWIHR